MHLGAQEREYLMTSEEGPLLRELLSTKEFEYPSQWVAGGGTDKRHTAVSAKLVSPSCLSTRPPGNAVCPAWVLIFLERVVNRTRSAPSFSYNKTRTAASLLSGSDDLESQSY